MPVPSGGEFPLGPGERLLGRWPAEPAVDDRNVGRSGWLVVTDRRWLFFESAGFFGGRVESVPRLDQPIERVAQAVAHRFWMPIGYGDRMELPGLVIDGHGFRLPRETAVAPVIETIERAREARRSALGYPLR